VIGALLVIGALSPRLARAEPEADDDLRRGVALRREGRDAEALASFQRALARSPSPRARAQVALAEQALALWLFAERDLRLALAEKDDPWIRQNREALERAARIVEGKLASVIVRTNVEHAEVLVNGAPSPEDEGGRHRVVAGQVTLEVRAAGYAPTSRTLQVPPETTSSVTLALARTAPESRPSPAPTPPPLLGPPESGPPLLGIALTATGVAGLGVGAFFGLRAISEKSTRDAECASGCTQAGVDADRAGRDAALVSTIATVAGVALTGAGIWVLVRSPAPKKAAVGLEWLGPGLRLRGTF